jgi:hypothetical protein
MAAFECYEDVFPHARLTRSQEGVLEGALEVVLHTDGGTLFRQAWLTRLSSRGVSPCPTR